MSSPAKIKDTYHFRYPKEPQFNCDLVVVNVLGEEPNDLVFFSDGSHSKQKNLALVPRNDEPTP